MQRQLRFRAWHPVKKIWATNRDIYKKRLDYFLAENTENKTFSAVGNCEFIIMQFIGLSDIDGREIYEGDILDILIDDEPFRLDIESIFDHWVCECHFDYANLEMAEPKIIGNIYENPELLEKTNGNS